MSTLQPLVALVDDDQSVREALPDLLRDLGFEVNAFSSAKVFLAAENVARTQCLILDIAMTGMSGPDLLQELTRRGHLIPVIFITAHNDERVRTHALEKGAVACLFKPFSDVALAEALKAAFRERGARHSEEPPWTPR